MEDRCEEIPIGLGNLPPGLGMSCRWAVAGAGHELVVFLTREGAQRSAVQRMVRVPYIRVRPQRLAVSGDLTSQSGTGTQAQNNGGYGGRDPESSHASARHQPIPLAAEVGLAIGIGHASGDRSLGRRAVEPPGRSSHPSVGRIVRHAHGICTEISRKWCQCAPPQSRPGTGPQRTPERCVPDRFSCQRWGEPRRSPASGTPAV